MNNKLNIVATFVLVINCLVCSAQTRQFNSSVELNAGHFMMPRAFSEAILQTGLGFERRLHKSFSVEVTYQRWLWDKIYNPSPVNTGSYVYYNVNSIEGDYYKLVGKLSRVNNYSYIDVCGKYHLKPIAVMDVFAGTGFSYAGGYDSRITYVGKFPGYEDYLIDSSDPVLTRHYGFNVLAGYDFSFLKNRFSVGCTGMLRYYTRELHQYNVNLTVKYNFSFLKHI